MGFLFALFCFVLFSFVRCDVQLFRFFFFSSRGWVLVVVFGVGSCAGFFCVCLFMCLVYVCFW